MSVSREISGHLPYLRRFARALVGSREGGDAHVLATLEAIVADPRKLQGNEDLRISLYKQFLKVWATAPALLPAPEAAGEDDGARRRLDAISLRPRVAFLLHALEGFDLEQVGDTLDISERDATALIDAANAEIADQIATNVLIIEDEPLIAHDLRSIVEELGHSVVGMARTHREAVAAVGTAEPGLILADIQLADGSSGLDAVNEILDALSTPVIFVTAYPERFLTGAPPEPAFLVTKPFSVESLKAVISQALFFNRRSQKREV
ncbi:response regulator [Methylocystis parvus]|uniref:Response regulator n=1 Tax=Methylocystis parvus TaxID=134 RepID=A0A6B8M2E7_9HYPH|nr:response regulator [Methylocystis parvus]QGM97041.1 response regulator [Methylocystis parvus]WBJ99064.1 response regulator [Methylocystis parvus OBBP]